MILIGSEKGGTSKTTIAVNLAIMRALAGRSVVVIDTDPQQSAKLYLMRRAEDPSLPQVACVEAYGEDVDQTALKLSRQFDDVVIDAGGRDCIEMRAAMLVADKMIIPMRPSQLDAWTLQNMAELVSEASKLNRNLKAHVLISGAASGDDGEVEAKQALAAVGDFPPLKTSKTIIHEDIAVRKAAISGQGVIELAGDAFTASSEFLALFSEVYNDIPFQRTVGQAS